MQCIRIWQYFRQVLSTERRILKNACCIGTIILTQCLRWRIFHNSVLYLTRTVFPTLPCDSKILSASRMVLNFSYELPDKKISTFSFLYHLTQSQKPKQWLSGKIWWDITSDSSNGGENVQRNKKYCRAIKTRFELYENLSFKRNLL